MVLSIAYVGPRSLHLESELDVDIVRCHIDWGDSQRLPEHPHGVVNSCHSTKPVFSMSRCHMLSLFLGDTALAWNAAADINIRGQS